MAQALLLWSTPGHAARSASCKTEARSSRSPACSPSSGLASPRAAFPFARAPTTHGANQPHQTRQGDLDPSPVPGPGSCGHPVVGSSERRLELTADAVAGRHLSAAAPGCACDASSPGWAGRRSLASRRSRRPAPPSPGRHSLVRSRSGRTPRHWAPPATGGGPTPPPHLDGSDHERLVAQIVAAAKPEASSASTFSCRGARSCLIIAWRSFWSMVHSVSYRGRPSWRCRWSADTPGGVEVWLSRRARHRFVRGGRENCRALLSWRRSSRSKTSLQ